MDYSSETRRDNTSRTEVFHRRMTSQRQGADLLACFDAIRKASSNFADMNVRYILISAIKKSKSQYNSKTTEQGIRFLGMHRTACLAHVH